MTKDDQVEQVARAIAEIYHRGPVDDAYMQKACSGSQWFYDAARAAIASLSRPAQSAELLEAAILEIVNAVRAYLPPDGIGKDELINRVIGATDNTSINPVILELENGRH